MPENVADMESDRGNAGRMEQEVESVDILLIFWKWKLLIVGGTLVMGVLAAIYGLSMTKIYRSELVIRPGILTIRDDGRKEYIETAENIKALIDAGTFNNEILKEVKKNNKKKIPMNIQFAVEAPRKTNVIKIKYLTSNREQGIAILTILHSHLLNEYSKIVQLYRNRFKKELSILKSEINKLSTTKKSYEMNLKYIEERIRELESEVDTINSNTKKLYNEREKFLENQAEESNILSTMLYSNTIQQNLSLSNTYKDEIYNYRVQKEEQLQQVLELENKIHKLLLQADKMEFDIENIENIQSVQPPSTTPYPVKPKIKLMVLLGVASGLFLTVFLAFFLEYTLKYRKMNYSFNGNKANR